PALDTEAAETAARDVAETEDLLLFYGEPGGFLMSDKSPRFTLGDWTEPGRAVAHLLAGVDTLDRSGIAGPYAAVLDPERVNELWPAQARVCGDAASEQLKERINHVYRPAAIRGGAVLSGRGSGFLISVGGDLSMGYRWQDLDTLHLFCVESVAGRLLTPDAVCLLTPA